MSISSVSKNLNDQTRFIKVSNEREKKSLMRNHEQDMEKLKKTQHGETEQIRSEHRNTLVAEKERQTEALKRIKEELERTQSNLNQQKEFMIERGEKNILEHKNNLEKQWGTVEGQFNEKMEEQKVRQKNLIHQSNQAFNDEQNSQIISHKDALSNLDEQSKLNLKEKSSQIQQRFAYENKIGEDQIRNIKREKHKQLQDQDSLWKHKISQQNTTNQIELSRQEKLWKKNFEDKWNAHQSLYHNTLEQQNNEIKRQAEHFLKEQEKIKTDSTSDLIHVMKKSSDPFYQNNSLRPKVNDKGDRYELKVKVADHEKDLYILSGQDRTLNLSFSRNFQQNIQLPDNVSKTRRVESYTQSFSVPQIINQNSISKKYEDGVLTFTVLKA